MLWSQLVPAAFLQAVGLRAVRQRPVRLLPAERKREE